MSPRQLQFPDLSFGDFSRELIVTGDLDPVYIVVDNMQFEYRQLSRWMLAYMWFYNIGVASYLSEFRDDQFYDMAMTAAINETAAPHGGRWPRASERRHFRGKQAIDAVAQTRRLHPKAGWWLGAMMMDTPDLRKTRNRIEEMPKFGPWASFKLCDLIERVVKHPILWTKEEAMYETPTKGARLVYHQHHGHESPNDSAALSAAESQFKQATIGLTAPPRGDRALGFPELETCLCKYKSYSSGHYYVGKDIHEITEAANAWRNHSFTADVMHQHCLNLARKGWME